MNETVSRNPPVKEPRGRLHAIAAGITLFIGVGAAILAIWHFSPPPPVVVQTPPEIKTVEKLVYVPKPAPAPPPVVAPVVELPRLIPTISPPPEPPIAKLVAAGAWDGVWRRKESPLPMFRLHQEDKGVAGTCAANWGDVVPVRGGDVAEGVLELVVDDALCRVHIRMAMSDPGQVKVSQWITDEDWMAGLERANKTAKTREQAYAMRTALAKDARKYRKPVPIGVFTRQSSDD